MAKVVDISCELHNGVRLQLFDMKERKNDSDKSVAVGPPVVLKPGANSGIDAEFWAKWAEQNKDSLLVKDGLLKASDEREEKTEG